MNPKKKNWFDQLMLLLTASIFFDAYDFFYIGTYPVTMFTVVLAATLIYGVVYSFNNSILLKTKESLFAIAFVVYACFNFLFHGFENISSFALVLFYFLAFVFSHRLDNGESTKHAMRLFSSVMNIMALYGIYQVIARQFDFIGKDIIIPNHMVEGFNWTNSVTISGIQFERSNAIFREPSFFSQFLALNILYLALFASKHKQGKSSFRYCFIAINFVALLCTVSGTGILVLVLGLATYAIIHLKKNELIKYVPYGILAATVLILFALSTDMGQYYLLRASEITEYREGSVSGYVRFVSGLSVIASAWANDVFFGTGVGTCFSFIDSNEAFLPGTTVNGIYRPAIEFGLVGLTLWLGFLFSFFKESNRRHVLTAILVSAIIPFAFSSEAFLSNYFWFILYLLNFGSIQNSTNTSLLGKKSSKKYRRQQISKIKKITIILVNYCGFEDTLECVQSLRKMHSESSWQILLLDNASPDGSGAKLYKLYQDAEDVHVVVLGTNKGFGGANNIGMRYAFESGADCVLLLNNDTLVSPFLLDELINHSDENTIVVPSMFYYSDPEVLWYGGGDFDRFGIPRHKYMNRREPEWSGSELGITFATGCCNLIPKKAYEKVGGFDDKFFLYWEDADLSLRWIKSGFSIVHVPAAKLWHKVSASTGGELSPLSYYYQVRNRLYAIDKHRLKFRTWLWARLGLIKGMLNKDPQTRYAFQAYRDYKNGKLGQREKLN